MLEPSIPAAKQEVVSLFHCIDNRRMAQCLDKLRPLFDLNAQYIARAKRFIAAAGSLYFDIERTAKNALLSDKINRYASNLAAKTMPKKSESPGKETLRLVSAVTPLGMIDFTESNFDKCDAVHIFEDRYGAAAHAMLSIIRDCALSGGSDIITCRSPMSAYDKIDAVYVPSMSLLFAHSSYLSPIAIKDAHVVRDKRFYDATLANAYQKRLAFCKKATVELLSEASALLADAKKVHDDIETYYKTSIDFTKVREREKQVCADIGLEP